MKINEILNEETGVIQPRTGVAQYATDIANAIRTGASGSYYTQGATATAYERAPLGTKLGTWEKTKDGWVNTSNNTAATPKEAETLDRKWYNDTQSKLRQQQQQKQQTPVKPDVGQPAPVEPTIVQTIITPTGQTVYLKSDKRWYRESGTVVIDRNDILRLNQMITNARELAKSKGTTVPKIIRSQSTANPEPTTPAVFTSNRPPAVFKSNRPR